MKKNARDVLSLTTRFWFKVWRRGDCWEWRGPRDRRGYGQFAAFHGNGVYAHRFAYELAKGTIPTGYVIDHLCRHPWCVKPSHLEAVRQRTNLLRGVGIPALNAQKTHCPNGHPYSNRMHRGSVVRFCRLCANAQWRQRYHANKTANPWSTK